MHCVPLWGSVKSSVSVIALTSRATPDNSSAIQEMRQATSSQNPGNMTKGMFVGVVSDEARGSRVSRHATRRQMSSSDKKAGSDGMDWKAQVPPVCIKSAVSRGRGQRRDGLFDDEIDG